MVTSLNYQRAFPSFDACPEQGDLDLNFYCLHDNVAVARRHWCLLAEIVDIIPYSRLLLHVKDRRGNQFLVAFYLDNGVSPPSGLKRGYTVALLYAHQRTFLDGQRGVRLDDTSSFCFMPLSLDEVFAVDRQISHLARDPSPPPTGCQACGETGQSLSKCRGCGIAWYCNKTCQKFGWDQQNHRRECKGMHVIQKMSQRDWAHYDDGWTFPF